jgi:hypothetical protein
LANRFQFDNSRIDKEDVQQPECLSDFVRNFALLRSIPCVGLNDDYIPKLLASRIQACLAEASDRDSCSFS